MANIYELTLQAQQLMALLEADEIDEQIYIDTLEGLGIDDKVESICRVIKNLEADAEQIKAEKDRLAKRQKTAENGVKRLKDSLITYMQVTNQSKVKTQLFNVSLTKSKALKVIDETMLPEQYFIPQPDKVDVAGLRKAIKEGEEIYGVQWQENTNLRIS